MSNNPVNTIYTIKELDQKPQLIVDHIQEVARSPTYEQCITGAVLGWCSGYILIKLLKILAGLVGTSFLGLLLCHYTEMIDINWQLLFQRAKDLARVVGATVKQRMGDNFRDKVYNHAMNHVHVTGGFLIGIFLGVATS